SRPGSRRPVPRPHVPPSRADHARAVGPPRRVGSVALPVAVLGIQLLLPVGYRLQRVLGLLAGPVGAEPVPLGAPVAGLHGVVLQAVEPGPLGHPRTPLVANPTISRWTARWRRPRPPMTV